MTLSQHPDEERDGAAELEFVAVILDAAGRDVDGNAPEWLRAGWLAEEVAPLIRELAKCRAQLTEAQADRERLDWLQASASDVIHQNASKSFVESWAIDDDTNATEYAGEGFTLRDAIDAARLASSSESGT